MTNLHTIYHTPSLEGLPGHKYFNETQHTAGASAGNEQAVMAVYHQTHKQKSSQTSQLICSLTRNTVSQYRSEKEIHILN